MLKTSIFFILLSVILAACTSEENNLGKVMGQENAVWTQGLFLRGYDIRNNKALDLEQIHNYTVTLRDHRVKYAYLFAGPFKNDGHLPDYPFSKAAIRNVQLMKESNPDLIILPWIGGVQNKQVYLGDSNWVKNALVDTKRLVEILKVPGVHVDLEYILAGESALDSTINKEQPGDLESYGENVNQFHKKLRVLLPKAFISSVVVSTSPDTKQWKRKTSMPELKVLVKYVNQLSFLFYDTRINDQETFSKNCRYLVTDIESLSKERPIQYLIGVGTFINEPALRKYRNLDIENLPNTLSTIRDAALAVNSSKQIVDGIAIATDWTTSVYGWDSFKKYWSGYD